MPTVGWILEGAVERFWEGQLKPSSRYVAPVYSCRQCGESFKSLDALRDHVGLEHPLELPALFIQGEPLLRESVIRLPLLEEHVELIQCSYCEIQIDGQPYRKFAKSEFRRAFVQPTNSTWNVRLIHERSVDSSQTQQEYHVRFRIPDPSNLNNVDEHFLQTLVLEELTHGDLERFESRLPMDVPTREYGGALGDYALGILLKERRSAPRSAVGFEEFAFKMRSALDVLGRFKRPVAQVVCSSIRFNLNDFANFNGADNNEVEIALNFFRNVVLSAEPDQKRDRQSEPKSPVRHAACPVDRITHELLAACSEMSNGTVISASTLGSLKAITENTTPVSEQDLAKIHVVCAEAYLRLSRVADALPHLRAVQFAPTLQQWAQHHLGAIANDEH
jgi:hypothetical protein